MFRFIVFSFILFAFGAGFSSAQDDLETILKNADAQTVKRAAQQQGMDSLRDDGARKVLQGRTTVEEVVAATQEDVIIDVVP